MLMPVALAMSWWGWHSADPAAMVSKRVSSCTEELYKKDLHDQDNNDCVITHLEPDILECKVKWALGSITMKKASRGDGIPVELFQILKASQVILICCQS